MNSKNAPTLQSLRRIELLGKDKQELVEMVLVLEERIKAVEEKVDSLTKKNLPKFPKTSKLKLPWRWKKLGRPEGHPGSTRVMPVHIDETIHQRLDACPDCGDKSLRELPSDAQEHVQEDIVPAKVCVTKFIKHGYWCFRCKQKKHSGFAPEEIPYGYLGPNVLIHTLLLKYHHGLPYSKIQLVFEELCGLKVTASALAQVLQRLARWLKVEETQILKAIRASPYIHADETGWKIAGANHWLWAFVNQKLALYKIRKSRGQKIPEEVLCLEYKGTVIADFLSAYDKIGGRRQRCLVHLLREMKECRKTDRSEEYLLHDKKLRRILYDSKRLEAQRNHLEPWVFLRRLRFLKERLLNFSCSVFSNPNWQRLSKRFLKYQNELLTFLEIKDLPRDNNHAERMIRPNVIFRKISFQNMSKNGAAAHEVLMSLLQTSRLQNKSPIPFFKEAYLKHRKGDPRPVLSF